MANPAQAEMKHLSEGGKTAQEIADDKAGMGNPHPSANYASQPKPPGPSIHPVAKGVYGAPIGTPILK